MENPFDFKIDQIQKVGREVPTKLVESAVYVHDTLELAERAARQIWGANPTPSVVFEIYDRINAERLRMVAKENA